MVRSRGYRNTGIRFFPLAIFNYVLSHSTIKIEKKFSLGKEQSSYSAMLSIPESVPPSEPVPSNSWN
jgi:hypothetical protein